MYFVKNRACRRAMQTMGRKRKREWNTIYPHAEKQALDLLDKLLTLLPLWSLNGLVEEVHVEVLPSHILTVPSSDAVAI